MYIISVIKSYGLLSEILFRRNVCVLKLNMFSEDLQELFQSGWRGYQETLN